MSVIQQVYLAEAGYSIYIKGIKPDKDNEYSGEITINGNPTRLERKERYHIDGGMLVTDSYHIPMEFIISFFYKLIIVLNRKRMVKCMLF